MQPISRMMPSPGFQAVFVPQPDAAACRLLLRCELRSARCHLTAEGDKARILSSASGAIFHFTHHRLLNERSKLFLFLLRPSFLALVEFCQHLPCEQLQ